MPFLDLTKAFDKVWHKGLLYKLKKIGITVNLFKWIESYLSNRKQRIVINDTDVYTYIMQEYMDGTCILLR